MESTLFLAFLATALVVVLSPGPDTTLILRNSIVAGTGVGLATVAGIMLGLATHSLATVLGLSLLIAASPTALAVIAIAGALYLGWLAIGALTAGPVRFDASPEGRQRGGGRRPFVDGLLSNLFNPKVILLFVSLVPQFVEPNSSVSPARQMALMGVTILILSLAWQIPLALAAGRLRAWLSTPAVQRAINIVTGIVLLSFAALMLRDHVLG